MGPERGGSSPRPRSEGERCGRFGQYAAALCSARAGVQVVRLLIAAGADVNAKNNDGAAPLVIALRNGQVTMAKTLIAAGAENVVMKTHFPKIHAEWEMQWMRSLLLHSSPDRTPRIDCGEIRRQRTEPAELAERVDEASPGQWGRPERARSQGRYTSPRGILERNEEAARLLVAHGVDVKARNLAGSTILHYAASEGLTEVISLLLTKGVDVNAQDNDDDTPLHGSGPSGPQRVRSNCSWPTERTQGFRTAATARRSTKRPDGATPR